VFWVRLAEFSYLVATREDWEGRGPPSRGDRKFGIFCSSVEECCLLL
jgi:hypothetical protein